MEDGTRYVYGDFNNVLRVDEQFLITITGP
jgi:hypothetical protein